MLVIVVASLALAINASREGTRTSTAGGGGTRFRARPGTMRENVQPMVSQSQERSDTSLSGDGASGTGGALANLTIHVSEAVLDRLLTADTMETIDAIQDHLAQDPGEEVESRLYSALAEQYLKLNPPETESAEESIAAAQETAQNAGDRHAVAYAQAMLFRREERVEEARAYIADVFEQAPVATAPGMRLAVLEGTLAEMEEDDRGAETAYRRVLTFAAELDRALSESAVESYRLAGLRLTRLLRRLGRTGDAEAVSRDVAGRLQQIDGGI